MPRDIWDLIDEIEVKHIIPREDAIATCIALSIEYPKFNRTKYVVGTMIIPPPTPKRPARNPESSPVNKKIIIKIVNNFSALKVFLL